MDVIILNGASSSGKSSIAKALQSTLHDNYLAIGIDTFIAMMPEKSNQLTSADQPSEGFYFKTLSANNYKSLKIQSGSYGKKINRAYHSTVKHLADIGLKLIVDDVMDGKLEQALWWGVLGDTKVMFVAVNCEPHELIAREKTRKDRIEGSAVEQASRVHSGVVYDLVVDTTNSSSKQCAQEIAAHVIAT